MSRVALVTGAGTGIGRATALALAQRGYAVALVGRTESTLAQVASEIESLHIQAQPIVADVSQPEQVERLVSSVEQHFGRLDVLVNNAGAAPAKALAKMSVEQWEEVLRTNLSSAFYMMRAFWPVLSAGGRGVGGTGGVIINISSMSSVDPFPGLGAYAVAKQGLNMLSLVAGCEGVEAGIKVVSIAPGAVDTGMFHALKRELGITGDVPMMRPEDVAEAVLRAIADASRLNGTTIFLPRAP